MSNLHIQKKVSTRTKQATKTGSSISLTGQSKETNLTYSRMLENEDTCTRCGGFMVSHWCMNVNYDAGGMEILTKRCLQCGEVIDPVILENRLNPNREELKKKTRPLLSRPLASSKGKSSGMSCSPLA
ncbi:MAG: hypothetical protein AB7P17_10770 [Nitrospirales bacterium]|nr:hypothetical protein [Nitrospirales bacterium]